MLVARKADIATYVNKFGGSFVVLGQSSLTNAYKWLPVPLVYTPAQFTNVDVTPDINSISNTSTGPNLSHYAWHGYFTGPPNWAGIIESSILCMMTMTIKVNDVLDL